MKIIVAGASGFIGRALVPALLNQGYELVVISRHPEKVKKFFSSAVTIVPWQQLDTLSPNAFRAVINLAGENIAAKRWTKLVKYHIVRSRIDTTRQLVNWLLTADKNKPHLYNASAVGIYPSALLSQAIHFTEETSLSKKTNGFAADLVRQWEAATLPAREAKVSVTLLRFGVALKRAEGVLHKLEAPFAWGLGSILGKGDQAFSWIHIDDLVNALLFLLKMPEIVGPVNFCAPYAVSQKIFAQTLARVMHKPLFITTPLWLVKVLLGQMGEELLLSGQNVLPERLIKQGFEFKYPTIQAALEHEFTTNEK